MKFFLSAGSLLVVALVLFSSCGQSSGKEQKVQQRVDSILQQMTLEEKVQLVTGRDYWGIAAIPSAGVPEINFANGPVGVRPESRTPLYPPGVVDSVKTTSFPIPVVLSSTWNRSLIGETGKAMGLESRWKNIHCLLAPGMNIQRVPYGGRNFEYFSEDPYLTAESGVSFVKGVQEEGVMVSVKHYACNNTDYERNAINMAVDERPLHEIYLYGFRRLAQEANPYTFMSAYNRVNGAFCSEHDYLLNEILKERWGYRGFVMSDWGATKRATDPVTTGLDLEMPREVCFGDVLLERVRSGEVDESVVDGKVRRILWALVHSGVWDQHDDFTIPAPDTREVATRGAEEGIVLLKNENGVLPLDPEAIDRIAVIGPNAPFMRLGGWGSSYICATETITPLEGIRSEVGSDVEVINEPGIIRRKDIFPVERDQLVTPDRSAKGLQAEYFNNGNLNGEPLVTRTDEQIAFDWRIFSPDDRLNRSAFSARWSGWLVSEESGAYEISVSADDGVRLYLDGKKIIDTWDVQARALYSELAEKDLERYREIYPTDTITRTPVLLKVRETVQLEKGSHHRIRVEYRHRGFKAACILGMQKANATSIEKAVQAAREADAAVIFAGLTLYEEREGADLPSLYLPEGQDELIRRVAAANPRTVVVLNNGTPLLINNWVDDVAGLVEAWYPGQYGGEVLAGILFGRINPSGKLPVSWMRHWEDTPVAEYYPAPDFDGEYALNMDVDDVLSSEDKEFIDMEYGEGIYVGYRHYDTRQVEPLFPFGHGLSYTDFTYESLQTRVRSDRILVEFTVTNTGERAGGEATQLYVRDMESSLERPAKELKDFKKVFLEPGESREIELVLQEEDLAYYDPGSDEWVTEPGEFELLLGSSSRDIRLRETVAWK